MPSSVKESIREIRKALEDIVKEGQETRREIQYTLHSLKVTPLREMFIDEIRLRRPLQRIRRMIRGED